MKADKRQRFGDDPEVYWHVAAYLAGKLEAARREVIRPVPTDPVSPPAYRG
jgi:hypothetical protein